MATVTIQQAKANLSRWIKEACQGKEVIIARGSKPVVRLVPIEDKDAVGRGPRKPGALKGKLFCTPDAFAPLTDRELNDLEFE